MAIVRFYGDLEQYGSKFKMNVETGSEAINGLVIQNKNLRERIINGEFRVRINKKDMNSETIRYGIHSKIPQDAVIHIIPRVAGSKGGLFNFIAGAALIVAGVFLPVSAGIGMALIGAGAGLMLGGVAQLLTKTPKTKKTNTDNNTNTSFSNLDNTISQGDPVPYCYGTIKTGSKVLSQGLETLNG